MTRRELQRHELAQKARKALVMFSENVTAIEAAKALGISRMTLYRGLKALDLADDRVYEPAQIAKYPELAATPAVEIDPLLDGLEELEPKPESDTYVTDSDLDDLLA